jgi:cell division protein FtsQ
MARRQTAQLDLEVPEEVSAVPAQTAPARRARARADAGPGWRERVRRWLLWAAVVAVVVAAIVAVYEIDQYLASDRHFVLSGNLEVHPSLSISGMQHAPRARVTAVFARDFGRSIYLMPPAERRRALMAIDWVRDATVSRRWPNRVEVTIVERTPVAFAMLPQSHGDSWLIMYETALVDGEGVILDPPARARFALPVLYGLTRRQTAEARRQRVRQVLELTAEMKSYAGQIAEINAADPDNLTITYSVQGRVVRLMLGNQRYLSRFKNFLTTYGEIGRRLPNARLFDLRLDDRITAVEGASDVR